MPDLSYSQSIVVARPAGELYDMVADVTRMGGWSPVCKACWWEGDGGPTVGSWFVGRNEVPGRVWKTRSQVVAADPGREFAWAVNGSWSRWGYTFAEVEGGTRVTESWDFLPDGIAGFKERYGEKADDQVANRREAAHRGIPVTLAALKEEAEGAGAS